MDDTTNTFVIPDIVITQASDDEDDDELDRKKKSCTQNDSSRGMLRSKIECGMGTVPLSPKMHLQTWDGVMSGDR